MRSETTSTEQILRWLRVALHVGFAALLLVGTLRALVPALGGPGTTPGGGTGAEAPPGVVLVLAALLAAVYLTGTVLEKRHAQGSAAPDPARYALPWLGVVCALWLALVAASGEFVWVAFALFFLQMHLLPRWWGVGAVAVTAAIVVLALWRHGGGGTLAAAMLLGPLFGAAFAVVTAAAYRALYGEAEAQRAAADELRRTRAELAESQHRAGVLAERERLAREIHDTLAQGFSSIVLMGRSVAKALDAGDTPAARERLGIVQATAADSLAEARAFVRGLSSPALGTADGPHRREPSVPPEAAARLPEALRTLCEKTTAESRARGTGMVCRFELDGEPRALAASAEETLLRAAQASLANVWAHAKASTAVVSLAYLDGEVTLDVFDDGTGFDTAVLPEEQRADGSGFGLRGLRERVEGIGGTLAVESAPGEGTVVAVRLAESTGQETP